MQLSVDFVTWSIFLAWDFLVSVWNGYAAGYNLRLMSYQVGKRAALLNSVSYTALAMGFVGAANSTFSILGILAASFINRLVPALIWLFDLTFVVTASVTVVLGTMMAARSISNRIVRSSSPPITIYDILTSVWDTALFVKETPIGEDVERLGLESLERPGYGLFIVMVLAAVAFPVINTYEAYVAGANEGDAFLENAKGSGVG